jgi:hypothetical protein
LVAATLAGTAVFVAAAAIGYRLWNQRVRALPSAPSASVGAPLASADGPPAPTSFGSRPALRGVEAGIAPGTSLWLAEFRHTTIVDGPAVSLLDAHARCQSWGLELCTESQWLRACSERPQIASSPSWTISTHTKGFVVRGGQGCGARAIAQGSERAPARAGLCCERGVGIDTAHRNKSFLLATTQRLLKLESVFNQRRASRLSEFFAETVLVDGKRTSKPDLLESHTQSFATWPDQWLLLDACAVDMTTPKSSKSPQPLDAPPAERASWSAECEQVRLRGGKLAGITTRWVFGGNGTITSVADVRVSRDWSEP